jgi:hypothetical protein
LNIHIVGADEIDKSKGGVQEVETSSSGASTITSPTDLLEKTLREKHGVDSFDDCKNVLRDLWRSKKYQNEGATSWNSFSDIPTKEARKLIAALS